MIPLGEWALILDYDLPMLRYSAILTKKTIKETLAMTKTGTIVKVNVGDRIPEYTNFPEEYINTYVDMFKNVYINEPTWRKL
jgi:hypothetical protein